MGFEEKFENLKNWVFSLLGRKEGKSRGLRVEEKLGSELVLFRNRPIYNDMPKKDVGKRIGKSKVTQTVKKNQSLTILGIKRIRVLNPKSRLTEQAKIKFLTYVADKGQRYVAAQSIGFTFQGVEHHLKKDPEFQHLFDAAMALYRDKLDNEIRRRGVDGWDEPVFNYKSGEVMGVIRKYSDRLLELHAKRHISEYRTPELIEATVKTSGVLVVAPGNASSSDWEAASKDARPPKLKMPGK